MTSFKITILGTGSAAPKISKHNSAHILNVYEQFYLIDCGEATQIQMRRYGVNPLKINALFITHLHGDHIFGLQGLLSTMSFMGRKTPLPIYGVRPLDEIIANHIKYFDPEIGFDIQFHEVDARVNQVIFENRVMTVSSIPLRHNVPCSGYLFREKEPPRNVHKAYIESYDLTLRQITALKRGEDITLDSGEVVANHELTYIPHNARSYAFCSDTQYSPKVASIVEGVDLLYHEATYLDSERKLAKSSGHSTALQASQVAASAGVGSLMIGHFSSRYDDETVLLDEAKNTFPNTILAAEGETVVLLPKK